MARQDISFNVAGNTRCTNVTFYYPFCEENMDIFSFLIY